jgi:microcystin degradation protein MlrC
MRIAVGQLWQETNTLNPAPTTRADFEAFGVVRGPELVERMADTNELGGFIQSLRTWPEKPEIVGLVRLPAWPGGLATAETFTWLREELVEALRQALPVDAVLLALHGSLAADGTPDVEGEILDAFRAIIGPEVPLVATLDLHANVTERMVRAADALVLYHTIPHIDVVETGQRGVAVLRRILDGARPVTAFQKLPLVVPVERANTQDQESISYGIREILQLWERDPHILAAGLATVQPWLDIPDLGAAVVVVTDGDAELARARCAELSAFVWERRRDYLSELPSVEEGVRIAFAEPDGLVVLGDGADATTSGSPGDGNHLLREMLKYDWPRPALVTLVDPELVAEAAARGPGAEFPAMLGGKRDHRFSTPVDSGPNAPRLAGDSRSESPTIAAVVRMVNLFDARFTMSGHLARNMPIDMGTSAVLKIGNVHIVVTSRSGPHFSPLLFQTAGIDPFAAQLLVAKSPCGFRAAYQGRAKKMLVVRSSGCAPSDFWRYPFRNIPRPLWPWDEIVDWTATPLIVTR